MRAPLVGLGLCAMLASARADVELKNDGFESEDMAAAQLGFAIGEIGASRFVAPDAGRQLLKVQLLFAGATTTQTITLRVYDDSAGTDAVGSPLFSGDFSVMGSDSAMQEITIAEQVTLPQQFRVGIEFKHTGAPSIARDTDGTIAADKNYIFAQGLGWTKSTTFGLQGDWIIRAFVSGTGGPGPGPDGGPISGDDCTGNNDCPVGQFCDTGAGSCTFECREDSDCGDGSCNSLGQCVGGGGGGGGGCCQTDRGGGEVGALLLGGAIGMLVLRRRRRCA